MYDSQDYGEILYSNREYDKAIAYYTQKINSGENDFLNSRAYYFQGRGSCYLKTREYEKAISDFSEAIKYDDSFSNIFYNRGVCYTYLGQHEKAIKDFSKVIELEPDDAEAYSHRAGNYFEMKQYEKALRDIDNAIKLDPANDMYYSNRNMIYSKLGLTNNNNSDCDDYNESDNDDCTNHINEAVELYFGYKPREAIVELCKAYIADSDEFSGFVNYIEEKEGQTTLVKFLNSALNLFNKMKNSGSSPSEMLQYMEQKCDEDSNIDFSKLHYNPKQGRKLDM